MQNCVSFRPTKPRSASSTGILQAWRWLMKRIPFKIGQPKKQIVPKTALSRRGADVAVWVFGSRGTPVMGRKAHVIFREFQEVFGSRHPTVRHKESIVERDFEREYGKLQQLEEQTKRLQKDMKKSTDADLAMSKSAVKISLDLLSNPLCEQDQDFLNMVTALDTAMKRMDAFNQEKVNQIQKTVIEPLKKFGSVFPSLNMAVKRREQALQDYRRLQAKVEKYEEKEKTGPVLAKLHQSGSWLGQRELCHPGACSSGPRRASARAG
ncbi:bridging integrator 3 isoform X5 [Physeter macrocephalus]|uniref:Bridging integrator 3 n=1 Tax=Physeter macrocephalus TaxID=9755 RepID=A0A9W2WW68_PHYMC|nr:bridging integrator 3 isoform X5 [Physeter catodon]